MSSDDKNAEAARARVLAEHELITRLTQQLTEAAADQLADCLQRLKPLLEHHFAVEEDEIDGLHSGIRDRTPEHVNALLGLKIEHRDLLQRVRELCAIARDGSHTARLRELCSQLRAELDAHETKESTLFLDSMWTDTRGGD